MNEREMFVAALEKTNPAARKIYLDAICAGDDGLRKRIDALLESHEQAQSFMSEPAGGEQKTIKGPTAVEETGTVIGRYKLLQQIGEGGMGTVYMAEQNEPVHRRVALKIIKPGMDTSEVIARFEAERQALAMMDHINIAHVFDAGATEQGRPYFVMELVNGIPITEYCDRNKLPLNERLKLFVQVCQAVQHAHQKGIIHRDIKPTNVLVTLYDGRPVPKIIDFGVAKAISHRLTERTLFTQFGQIVGTPQYMSPEQAEMSGLGVDTRSDIFSLGVLLYELMTGSTPIQRERLRTAGYAEMQRIIREQEPPKPSTRLSESGDALSTIAQNRRIEPRHLSHAIRGDVDWIVMKALEKDRTRRYETANGFARDIQRYLNDEPVEASPPSIRYLLRKYARKHKKLLATGAAFAAILLLATGVSFWQAVSATRAKAVAVAAEKQAKIDRDMARKVVDEFFIEVSQSQELLRGTPGTQQLRKRLLERAEKYYEDFTRRRAGDEKLQAALAAAHFRLAMIAEETGEKPKALAAYRKALEIRERLARDNPSVPEYQNLLAETYNNIGGLHDETGNRAEALAAYRKALEIQERLTRENPGVAEYQNDLAIHFANIGKQLSDTGNQAEALAARQKSLEIYQRLVRENPADKQYQSGLAFSYVNIGLFQKALEIRERLAHENPTVSEYQSDLAASYYSTGDLHEQTGKRAEALSAYKKALEIQERLARENPAVTDYQNKLARSYNRIGGIHDATGKRAEALSAYKNALEIRERLVRENPTVTYYQDSLAGMYNNIGGLHSDTGKRADALAAYKKAIKIRERLFRDDPTIVDYAVNLGGSYVNQGKLVSETGQPEAALDWFRRGIETLEGALKRVPGRPTARLFLRNAHLGRANALWKTGKRAEALADYRKTFEIGARLVRDYPTVVDYAVDLGGDYVNQGNRVDRMGEPEPALDWYRRGIETLEGVLKRVPRHATAGHYLRNAHLGRAKALEKTGKQTEALDAYRKTIEIGERLVRDHPTVVEHAVRLGGDYVDRGYRVGQTGEPEPALDWFRRGIETLEGVLKCVPRHETATLFLRNAHWSRASTLDKLKRPAQAVTDWERAIDLDTGQQRQFLRSGLGASLARAGDHVRAVGEAKALAETAKKNGSVLYDVACVYSLAAAAAAQDKSLEQTQRAKLAAEYALHAIDLLNRAQAAGFFKVAANVEWMRKDSDLDSLRMRADFKKLLSELQKNN